MTNLDSAMRYVMKNEDGVDWDHDTGEFTNDPRDPGGATKWGVIKTEYESFLGRTLSIDDVKAMPRETAVQIYGKKFWAPIRGNEIRELSVATALLDTAVNKGLGGCKSCLRDALRVSFDTSIPYSDATITAINAKPAIDFMKAFEPAVERYIAARIAKYPNMEWARKGWMNRARRLLTLVQHP